MTSFFLLLSISGISGMTWLFPFLATVFSKRTQKTLTDNPVRLTSLIVVIPAHNEERVIKHSLTSIKESFMDCQTPLRTKIFVGADGCSDKTAEIAKAEGATVVESETSQGKWNTLRTLLALASKENFEWVACADAGIMWPRELVSSVANATEDASVLAVNPAYRNPGGGEAESLTWEIERSLKSLEGKSGGPVSLHGATIFFKLSALRNALEFLEKNHQGKTWLNDDVVLPLLIRVLHPEGKIVYLDKVSVSDLPAATEHSRKKERRRRIRMVAGNAQWIRDLLPQAFRLNKSAAMIALRRVFRILWAYWLGFLALGVLLYVFGALITAIFVGIGVTLWIALTITESKLKGGGTLLDAAWASLLAPLFLLSSGAVKKAVWR